MEKDEKVFWLSTMITNKRQYLSNAVNCHIILPYQWRIQDFPEEGTPTPRGAPTYDFAKISQKPHEIERI